MVGGVPGEGEGEEAGVEGPTLGVSLLGTKDFSQASERQRHCRVSPLNGHTADTADTKCSNIQR